MPFHNIRPSENVARTLMLRVSRLGKPWLWSLDGDDSYPMSPTEYAEDARLLYDSGIAKVNNQNFAIRTQNDSWINVVFIVADLDGSRHPMRTYNNKGYLLGRGVGVWKWSSVTEAAAAQLQSFNFVDPQDRDSFTTLSSAGVFMLHCRMQSQFSGRMALATSDGVDDLPSIPVEYGATGEGA
ncbi:hypothetical protein DOTSEDRAFT_76241 [Dothistroma septosporum NZE10]|uniref:Uncharacterized protein n=1 Tax=Dothistroma septosporum (strain NZE10 / CBS 128990) TaxID=675120 RepID=N1Q091_DOTSN|nr:hypothetical protein DOTSEDRAFT_76241 [Dothistroma septosporum NZE10]